jgi:hypothetical protein
VPHQPGERSLVNRVQGQDLFQGVGRLVAVEEFLLVDRCDALPERDLLARRRGGADL